MRNFLKKLLSDSNEINEHTFLGLMFFVATICSAFIPGIEIGVFFGFLGATLACFGIKTVSDALAVS